MGGDQQQPPPLDAAWRQAFRRRLLAWFRRHARDLPWRASRDAYGVWVSEIMLQQTQAATVVAYYRRFVDRFPNLESLAAAEESDVLRMWEGLGYYRRARQMHWAARRLVERGERQFPADFEAVRELPGIGRYTAGAILSIAHDQPWPILEANTVRLYSRLMATPVDPRSASGQRSLWEFAEALIPRRGCGEFNQALMELGALLCTPRSPQCERCPVNGLCRARLVGKQHEIPVLPPKKQFEDRYEAALIVEDKGNIALRRCQPGERWAGLWDFPRFELGESAPSDEAGEQSMQERLAALATSRLGGKVRVGEKLAVWRHGVTRYRITLACYRATLTEPRAFAPESALAWAPVDELESLPLSTTGRRMSRLATQEFARLATPAKSAGKPRKTVSDGKFRE